MNEKKRTFANITDATSFALKALGFRSRKLRDFICGLQGVAGARQEFDCTHLALARRLDHGGKVDTAETFVSRSLAALEKEQHRTGKLLFGIERGGGSERKPTRYIDYLTPAMVWAVERAMQSETWKTSHGRAIEEQIPAALEMLPPATVEESSEDDGPGPESDGVRIARNRAHVIARARAIFEIIAENGGDVVAHAESLANELLERAHLIAEKSAHEEAEGVQICTPSPEERPENIEENVSLSDAELTFAARGWRVFPCAPKDKRPLIREWQNRATTDAEVIERMRRRWPDANIGIATGAGSNLIVLDVDFEKGGDASLCQLIEDYGDFNTARVKTGAGLHFYFRHPGVEVRNSAGRLGEGLDIRGDGGYVIAPPSVHPNGGRYEWLKASPIAPLPGGLFKLLTEEKRAATATKSQPQAQSGPLAGALIVEGQRNEMLFKRACSLRGRGAEQAEIESHLLEVNAREVSPPLPASEIQKIARSAASYAPNRVAVGA